MDTNTFSYKAEMYWNMLLSSKSMLNNFLILYLRDNDKLIPPEKKVERDNAADTIFWTSMAGKASVFGLFTSKLSFLQGKAFNPINDAKVFLLSYGILLLADALPIMYYYDRFEPLCMKFSEYDKEYIDIYKNSTMNLYKLWYFDYLM